MPADLALSTQTARLPALFRAQEWEEEDREATRHDVAHLLRGVVRRCAAKDRDFWPCFEIAAAGGSASLGSGSCAAAHGEGALQAQLSASSASSGGLAADIWQLLGLHPAPASSAPCAAEAHEVSQPAHAQMTLTAEPQHPSNAGAELTAEHAAWAEAEAAQLLRYERQAAEAAAAPHGTAKAAKAAAQAQATLVVVTLGEALSQVASELAALGLPWTTLQSPPPGVVHVTLSDVARILAATPPARAAAAEHARMCERLAAAADAAAESARSVLPWPRVQLSRRSALRWVLPVPAAAGGFSWVEVLWKLARWRPCCCLACKQRPAAGRALQAACG